jgi:hypothetical protein
MGVLRDPLSQGWMRPQELRTDFPISPTPEKTKKVTPEKSPEVRFSYDGFWMTQHPTAKAFSRDWFSAHLSMVPYCWDMIKMAFVVSKFCVVTVTLGTLGRAVVDAAQIYAYTRFVHEVQSPQYVIG